MGKSQRYASVYSVGMSDFTNSDTNRYQYANLLSFKKIKWVVISKHIVEIDHKYIQGILITVKFITLICFVMEMLVYTRDVQGNGKCGIPIPSVRFPWEWEPNC